MKVQSAAVAFNPRTSVVNRPASEDPKPQDPQDGFESGGSEFGNTIKFAVGGGLGLATVIPATYAGVLGGAVAGSIFGAGFSPAIAAVTSSGALNFLGNVLSGTSTAAKVGMFVGGLSGVVGGWKVGSALGKSIGNMLGAEPDKPSKMRKLNGIGNTIAMGVTGIGTLAGTTGGAMIGAGLMATGSLVASGFSFEGIAGKALYGAIGGGAFGAITGAAGGYTISKGALNGNRFPDGQSYRQVRNPIRNAPVPITGAF